MPRRYLKKLELHPRITNEEAVEKGMDYYFPLGNSKEFNPIYRGVYRVHDMQPMEEIDNDYKHSKYDADPSNYDDDVQEPEKNLNISNQDVNDIVDILKNFFSEELKEKKKARKASERSKPREQKSKSLEARLRKLNSENIKLKKRIERLVKTSIYLNRNVPDDIKVDDPACVKGN